MRIRPCWLVRVMHGTYTSLLQAVQVSREEAEPCEESLMSSSKAVSSRTDLLTLKHSVRAGAFDLKQKADSGGAGRMAQTGVLTRSLLSINSRGLLALAESDKVHFLDAASAGPRPLKSDDDGMASSSAPGC